ncbi:hypothetical protein F4W66_25245 (plasmid) [Escherichia coli]|nr:hypothetical protein F4W66_25245 [Escherichia coli]
MAVRTSTVNKSPFTGKKASALKQRYNLRKQLISRKRCAGVKPVMSASAVRRPDSNDITDETQRTRI